MHKLIIQNLIQKEVKQIKQKNPMTELSKMLHRIRQQMPASWDSNYPKIDQKACLHRLRDSL